MNGGEAQARQVALVLFHRAHEILNGQETDELNLFPFYPRSPALLLTVHND